MNEKPVAAVSFRIHHSAFIITELVGAERLELPTFAL